MGHVVCLRSGGGGVAAPSSVLGVILLQNSWVERFDSRFVTVEEIAALVAWLCTRECSFSTGAVFDISGGRATY